MPMLMIDVEREVGADADRGDRREPVLHLRGEVEPADDDDGKQHENHERAEKSELLRYHRIDEIAVALGEKGEKLVRAVEELLPHEAARADRELRLVDLPPRAEDIRFGPQKREDALLLVRLEPVPRHRHEEHDPEVQSRRGRCSGTRSRRRRYAATRITMKNRSRRYG